jgi:hypothetical protein
MLRRAFAGLDLTRDTVIVTADHGHVAPGGHGGVEPEVSRVPWILAGAGIARGAAADARLIDVAPTVAALLGVPAPGHAAGHALTSLLTLSPIDASRRLAIDDARAHTLAGVTDLHAAPDPRQLAFAALIVAVAIGLSARAGRSASSAATSAASTFAVSPGSLVGLVAFAAMILSIAVITRGRLSPSYVPSFARTMQLGAGSAALAIAAQLAATWRLVRRAPDRAAAARGIALVGLAGSLAITTAVRAWYAPPFLDVPPPVWMVVVPSLDLAAAACAVACALTCLWATAPSRPTPRSAAR